MRRVIGSGMKLRQECREEHPVWGHGVKHDFTQDAHCSASQELKAKKEIYYNLNLHVTGLAIKTEAHE